MIALSGAHTIGFSHCDQFSDRLYSSPMDPTLNQNYAQELIVGCPRNVDPNIVLALDSQTEHVFDNLYYQNLVNGKGLLSSDQVLFNDDASKSKVVEFANDGTKFFDAFVVAIKKLGRVGVKTGQEGEIRRDCSKFN
jgi:peroxidase